MKNLKCIFAVLGVLVSEGYAMAQSKNELKEQNENLKLQIELLKLQQQAQQQNNTQQGNPQQAYYDNGGRGVVVQQSRLEKRVFESPEKLRTIGEDASREAQSARNVAELQARAQMQRNIEGFVKDALERYRKETQLDDAKKDQANDEQLSQGVAKGILNGCRVIDYELFYNASTKKYTAQVLVEYDKAGVMGLLESQEAAIMRNRAIFEKHMQDVFDEYEYEKTGSTYTMRKKAAENAMEQDNLDRQAKRDAQTRQQNADNDFREQESKQNYNLNRQRQYNKTVEKMQQQKIEGEIQKGDQIKQDK